VAEGARLESVFRGNSNVGSNPTLSASSKSIPGIENQHLSSLFSQMVAIVGLISRRFRR
jgi:hypothetical protein